MVMQNEEDLNTQDLTYLRTRGKQDGTVTFHLNCSLKQIQL